METPAANHEDTQPPLIKGAKVDVAEYPELSLLCWNLRELPTLTRREAFDLYEARWRFVKGAALIPKEAALIEALANEFGAGVING